ncbi:hypothetical protein V3472_05910 [Lacticaseibacillus rhamnosus]
MGLHQTFWLLVGLALLAVGIKLLLHTRRPHAALTSRFLGSLPEMVNWHLWQRLTCWVVR